MATINKKRIGITGPNGFVANHLAQTLILQEHYEVIPCKRAAFEDSRLMDQFVSQCDVIVHLAAVNRHHDQNELFEVNLGLSAALVDAFERTNCGPMVIFSSSTQEERDNLYGQSKKQARELLSDWAKANNATFCGMVVPNVFGPFGDPFYNSVVATFCHQLTHGEQPQIQVDADINLIYVGELVHHIMSAIEQEVNQEKLIVEHTSTMKVSSILDRLIEFQNQYVQNGEIPLLVTKFDIQLFNTFRCYMPLATYFPKKYIAHRDDRGAFVELIRHGISGQSSFSTTVPGITRGNHFHTRKIERFAVIKGKALIEMRRIGTIEVLSFELNGDEPSYVDMPIWYTHNIKNIGESELLTAFWINEPYDPTDPDTYFINV
jgi:UDP-2-acetamido-2,6-beta-L-arabino-hexul-4-ose reductase